MSFLFGLAACAFGLWGVWVWRGDFLLLLRGFLPISLFLSGALAIVIGLSSWRAKSPPSISGQKDHDKDE